MTEEITSRRFQIQHESMRVEFRWHVDRFEHSFRLGDRLIAKSVEGDSSAAWPPSPPLQDLSLETINEVPTLLGVGGAGSGHWSISAHWDESNTGFAFDIACRNKANSTSDGLFLGSTYQVEEPGLLSLRCFDADSTLTVNENQKQVCPSDCVSTTSRWRYWIGCSER